MLRIFVRRNHGKTVKFNEDGLPIEASEYSPSAIDKIAKDAAERQVDLERKWAEYEKENGQSE